jgi:hypothetical protein
MPYEVGRLLVLEATHERRPGPTPIPHLQEPPSIEVSFFLVRERLPILGQLTNTRAAQRSSSLKYASRNRQVSCQAFVQTLPAHA